MQGALNTSFSNGNWLGGGDNDSMKISSDRKTFSWYSYSSDPVQQRNYFGLTYYFAAIGGYDMGGIDEWAITKSGTWVVPKTGRYYMELYGA